MGGVEWNNDDNDDDDDDGDENNNNSSLHYASPEAFASIATVTTTSTIKNAMSDGLSTTTTSIDGIGGGGSGNNNGDATKFSSDLWALGVVLLELTSCHLFQVNFCFSIVCCLVDENKIDIVCLFQIRNDRLKLGKAAFKCDGDAERWRSLLAPFLDDIVVSMAHCRAAIANLLSVDRNLRVELPFLSDQQ